MYGMKTVTASTNLTTILVYCISNCGCRKYKEKCGIDITLVRIICQVIKEKSRFLYFTCPVTEISYSSWNAHILYSN